MIKLLFFLVCIFCCTVQAQTYLRIIKGHSSTEIYTHSDLRYKTKGHKAKRSELIAMRDSLLFFANGDTVMLTDLKRVTVKDHRELFRPFQKTAFAAAALLASLTVVNSWILGQEIKVTPGLVAVTGSCLAAGGVFYLLRDKRIRITRNTSLVVIVQDFQRLNPDPKPEKEN